MRNLQPKDCIIPPRKDFSYDPNVGEITLPSKPPTPQAAVYQFLLGIAALSDWMPILSLLDLNSDQSTDGLPAQCIYALSGLALHPIEGLTISQMADMCVETVRHTFQIACETNDVKGWVQCLIEQNNPCTNAKITALNRWAENTILKQEKPLPPDVSFDLDMMAAAIRRREIDQIKNSTILAACLNKFTFSKNELEILLFGLIDKWHNSRSQWISKMISTVFIHPEVTHEMRVEAFKRTIPKVPESLMQEIAARALARLPLRQVANLFVHYSRGSIILWRGLIELLFSNEPRPLDHELGWRHHFYETANRKPLMPIVYRNAILENLALYNDPLPGDTRWPVLAPPPAKRPRIDEHAK